MTWETIEQRPAKVQPTRAAVSLALSPLGKNGQVFLWITVHPDTADQLGWGRGDMLGLQVGRAGKMEGWVRVAPGSPGRALRPLPRSAFLSVCLVPPTDLGKWTATRTAAEEFRLLPAERALLAKLPWSFEGEAPEAQAA